MTNTDFVYSASAPPAEIPTLSLLLFRLADEHYTAPSSCVREILRYRPITGVPGAPPTLPGVLNHRGVILPVVDLRLVLGLPAQEQTRATRLVVVQYNDVDAALLVDAVLDLIILPVGAVDAVPAGLDPVRSALLRGVAQHDELTIGLFELEALTARLRENG